jgi:hypothetical protein
MSQRHVILLFPILVAGCGATTQARTSQPRAIRGAAVSMPSMTAIAAHFEIPTSAAVVTVTPSCTQGATEACNGVDDDCDEQRDEACGLGTGALQITLAWASGADLDLYVVEPSGYVLSYQNRQSPSGAIFDRDGRSACDTMHPDQRVENVYWYGVRPGSYRIEVRHWGACGTPGVVQATLAVAVGRSLTGLYNVALQPRERRVVGSIVIE